MTEAQENGYVECGECGHQIEQHSKSGCDIPDCSCRDQWTIAQIKNVRQREGLPGEWRN